MWSAGTVADLQNAQIGGLLGDRLGLGGSALAVFEDMRRRGVWAPEDTYSVNLLLDALSADAPAAFATCACMFPHQKICLSLALALHAMHYRK